MTAEKTAVRIAETTVVIPAETNDPVKIVPEKTAVKSVKKDLARITVPSSNPAHRPKTEILFNKS
jgi:hypothetical protein